MLQDSFGGKNDLYSDKEELLFYYCKNEKNITEKLDEIIMPIKFFSKEFSYIFEINSSDILMVKNEYIYFEILFRKNLPIIGF